MIRNQWYVVLESRELGGRPLGALRMGERMVFWRDEAGRATCHVDKCAHRGASLAGGKLIDGRRIQCPFHGLEYESSGACALVPANGRAALVPEGLRLPTYPVHEEAGFIWIWWGAGAPPAPPSYFEDIPEGMPWSTVRDPWDNHYSRVIENQLDMAHLPFVHHNTIGRGHRTVVEGPAILFRDEGFFVYVYNKADDGKPPRPVEELPIPRPGSPQKLEFRFPNLWENYIGEKLRVVGAFVPVDSGHTLLYLRFYQSFMRLPLLKGLVQALGNRMNLFIGHQDRRVVNTQVPVGPGEGSGELLFPGDRAIMEYRKLRQAARSAP